MPGTAVLTGSTRHDALPRTAQALTGRLHVLTILPLSEGEIAGRKEDVLERLIANPSPVVTTLGHPNVAAAGRGIDADRTTIDGYMRLLEDLFLVQTLPAWGTTLRARAVEHPKIHMVDSGLAARLSRCREARLGTLDPSALSESAISSKPSSTGSC